MTQTNPILRMPLPSVQEAGGMWAYLSLASRRRKLAAAWSTLTRGGVNITTLVQTTNAWGRYVLRLLDAEGNIHFEIAED